MIVNESIVAIVVTWNPDLNDLKRSLSSYVHEVRTILVDNGSKNDLSKLLKYDNLKILKLDRNRGIAEAINIGIEYAKKLAPEKIVFFDQDSILEKGAIQILDEEFIYLKSQGIDNAVIGPMPVDYFEKKPIGIYLDAVNRAVYFDGRDLVEMDSIYTSGMLMDFSLATSLPQNEKFFIDYVDTEWCYRAAYEKKSTIFFSTKARIFHAVGDSSVSLSFFRKRPLIVHAPVRQYYQLRNSIWMLSMPHIPIRNRISICFRCFLRVVFLTLFVKPRNIRLKFLILAVFHGFKNR